MAATTGQMTADDLLALPEDGLRRELIAGELIAMAPSGAVHGEIVALICASLGVCVASHRLGRGFGAGTGFSLAINPDTVRAPDVAFVSRERLDAAGRVVGYWPGAPDLAIEVVSPHDLYTEVEAKVAMWLAHGTRLVIVVNPGQRTAVVHRGPGDARHLTIDDVLDAEPVVPGWRLPLGALFRS